MQPIISVVGKSKSGKTTLLESLTAELKQRGYRVAIIKHSGDDFELDTVSKDTWRFSQAGSEVSAINSAHNLAVFRQVERNLNPQELPRFIGWDYDLILTEGFKKANMPKIEVHRKEQGEGLLCPLPQLLAVVTDEPLDIAVPQFSKDEIKKIADLIEERILTQSKEDDIELLVNNERIPLTEFPKSTLVNTLLGMISALKGVKEVKTINISLRRRT